MLPRWLWTRVPWVPLGGISIGKPMVFGSPPMSVQLKLHVFCGMSWTGLWQGDGPAFCILVLASIEKPLSHSNSECTTSSKSSSHVDDFLVADWNHRKFLQLAETYEPWYLLCSVLVKRLPSLYPILSVKTVAKSLALQWKSMKIHCNFHISPLNNGRRRTPRPFWPRRTRVRTGWRPTRTLKRRRSMRRGKSWRGALDLLDRVNDKMFCAALDVINETRILNRWIDYWMILYVHWVE